MHPLYLHGACAISPQHSFDAAAFLHPLLESGSNRLYVVDAPYSEYINPVAIRRMSRLLKMSITAGRRALQNAGFDAPDAIITGTGRGSMTDTEHFLNDMIRLEEGALNPTYFIQSTYNSPNGWLAMQTKCNGYNQTYVHRGHSLELALLDAQMLLAESGPGHRVLVGCYDEMTEEYFKVKSKIGYWKKELASSAGLLQQMRTPGTIGGEGAAFFAFSGRPEGARCVLHSLQLLQPPSEQEGLAAVQKALRDADLDAPDLVLAGMNGDSRAQPLYETLYQHLPEAVPVAGFKQLCGEYDTTSGFALWLCDHLFHTSSFPESILYKGSAPAALNSILLVNHSLSGNWSVMLLKAPPGLPKGEE